MDTATIILLDKLRDDCGDVGREGRVLIEWLLDEKSTFIEALEQEREYSTRIAAQLDEACVRLNRLGDHLRTLTVYAEGDNDHTPPLRPLAGSAGNQNKEGPQMSRLLTELDRGPATAYDLADATGMSADSCRAQLSELLRLGVVKCITRVPREVTVKRMTALYETTEAAR